VKEKEDGRAVPSLDTEGLERIRPFMDKVGTRLIHPALGQAVKPEACVPSCPFISKGDAPVSLDFTCLD